MDAQRHDIEFSAAGTTLRGWLFLPDDSGGPFPAVVMAHGLSAVKEMGLDDYARVFADAGLAVLAYDNRNLGASDGEPRQEIDPVMQRRDYSEAVTWLAQRPEIDGERIGVWGTSYTGGLAILSAVLDRRIRCVVAQVPYLHALATEDITMTPEAVAGLERLLARDRSARATGKRSKMVEICSDDPARPADSATRISWAYFNHYVAAGRAPAWRNEMTVRSLELRREYDAVSLIDRVAPTPLMLIVAERDDITPTRIALDAYARAREPKSLVMIAGHHYRPYLDAFDQSSNAARDWFATYLCS